MKILIMIMMCFLTLGCATKTGKVDADTNKISYYQDERTGLCFAVMGSRKAISPTSSGLGMACVPCSPEVMELVKR